MQPVLSKPRSATGAVGNSSAATMGSAVHRYFPIVPVASAHRVHHSFLLDCLAGGPALMPEGSCWLP